METTVKTAGQKAAETRARNKALLGLVPKSSKVKGIVSAKVTFKRLDESNFHMIHIDTPCKIYVHKKLNTLYITPEMTNLTGE